MDSVSSEPEDMGLLKRFRRFDPCVTEIVYRNARVVVRGVHDVVAMVTRLREMGYDEPAIHPCAHAFKPPRKTTKTVAKAGKGRRPWRPHLRSVQSRANLMTPSTRGRAW